MTAHTVQQVIDEARVRHWALREADMPEGAALAFLNARQRSVLLRVIESMEALLGETDQVALLGTDRLVALDDNDVPYFATTYSDGWPVSEDANGVPYVDFSADPIAGDPFGENGGTPGFPLPADLLRLVSVSAISSSQPADAQPLEVNVLEERNAAGRGGSLQLRAFINAGRLVPVRTSSTDLWSTVTAIRLSLIRCPMLTALTDTITVPQACVEVLVACVAELMATAAPKCTEPDKRRFENQRKEAYAVLDASAASILDGVTSSSVIVR